MKLGLRMKVSGKIEAGIKCEGKALLKAVDPFKLTESCSLGGWYIPRHTQSKSHENVSHIFLKSLICNTEKKE